ncbi:GroES-like protein [Schizophyllum commune H4-8]|uniref:GroES-like protein n=1 Tax=Schizophyllum commune (strain H4-8 / FGSC 9210) TaxID=578458 RepID=UPI00215EDB22|nr:GroES-like protein [Schizophyllum commune H4-8]KAI5895254.1 GroES-like protein [Schizophyllum commune H4-8]
MAAPPTIPKTQLAVLVGPKERRLEMIPVGVPGPDEVLIKNIAVASNPKDWKVPQWIYDADEAYVEGNDVAGTIVAVGKDVSEYEVGARVAAFTKMRTKWDKMGPEDNKYGAYQQYTVSPAHVTFPIPDNISFEEAATLPLAVMTAAIGLFVSLAVPAPGTPEAASNAGKAIIVNGAASSVGAFAVQLAKRAGLYVVATAGSSKDYAKELGADVVVDYREYKGDAIIDALVAAVGGRPIAWASDAVSDYGSALMLARTLARLTKSGAVTTVLPAPENEEKQFPAGILHAPMMVGTAHFEDAKFAAEWYRKISRWLADGSFKPNRPKVLPRGLESVAHGLELLETGNVHAEKLVYRIADTPSLKA